MHFNGDTTEEVTFSFKRFVLTRTPLFLVPEVIATKPEHKYLVDTLDSKFNFESHIREAIIKAGRGIGLIKHLSKCVSRHVLNQIKKLYMRPHLEYGHIIYHRYDPGTQSTFTHKLRKFNTQQLQQLLEDAGGLVDKDFMRNWVRNLCTRDAGIAGRVIFLI